MAEASGTATRRTAVPGGVIAKSTAYARNTIETAHPGGVDRRGFFYQGRMSEGQRSQSEHDRGARNSFRNPSTACADSRTVKPEGATVASTSHRCRPEQRQNFPVLTMAILGGGATVDQASGIAHVIIDVNGYSQ
jgi:hypothetical protein